MELRKDVVGWEGLYQVSNLGRIKILSRNRKGRYGNVVHNKEKIMRQQLSRGYLRVTFHDKDRMMCLQVHRLKAIAFIPNPLNLPCINHRDGNRSNNGYNADGNDNVEWCTWKYNVQDGRDRGRIHPRGTLGMTGIKNKKSKKIMQYSLDGKIIKLRDSVHDVYRGLGYSVSHICKCCRENRGSPHGYIRKYK